MKEEILKAVKRAFPELKISLEDIELEHPAVEAHGDYSTNIALKLAKKLGGKKNFLENIDWIVKTINKDNFENYKEPVPVGKLLPEVKKAIEARNELVYLKPRIYAKWCGWWREHRGHKEILPFLGYLPSICFSPLGVYKDRGDTGRFLLSFSVGHFGMLVIEILEEKNKNEIVTAFYFDKLRLSEYEEILNLEKSSLGKLRPASLLAPRLINDGVAGAISSLQESQEFYNTLNKKSQEEILFYEEKLSPQEVAEKIVAQLCPDGRQGEAKNGFINFWLTKEELIKKMNPKAENNSLAGKKIMVEFAHPNTHKQFHIGHLRNITLGETVSRLLTICGAKIIRANYQGDVGMHVAKALWGVQKLGKTAGAYVLGNKAFEEDEKAKKEIVDLNKKIYQKDPEIMPLWEQTRQESLDYFDKIYQRVYTKFDRLYFESEVAERGKELVLQNVGKFFEKSEGAIIFRAEHTRVFVNSEGNPTYEAKDMGLGELQFKEYNPDLIIHNVGPEQASYFEVIFVALAKILPQTAGREKHLAYGWVKLKEGKMSSRTGNVVLGEWLLDEIKKRLGEKYPERLSDLEPVAVAAAKYSLLKIGREQEIAFDIDESISLEGDSGPYLQYTYARARSVLRKSVIPAKAGIYSNRSRVKPGMTKEEIAILRYLYKFPEVVEQAAKQYSPNLICSYLFELAKRFNYFYNNCPILENNFRLMLTVSCGDVLKTGLNLLGIEALEKM